MMLQFNENGIYCRQADIYIDPWKPVSKAIITHAHSDHARRGSVHYLCHTDTVPLLRLRLGNDISVEGIEYKKSLYINGVHVSLYPAGHIIGSAQVRLEYKGEIWVVSGDYKLQNDGLSVPFEPVVCHSFVTESTFALPVYKFPAQHLVASEMNEWCRENSAKGVNTVIIGYALGKAQRILQLLDCGLGPVYTHGAVDNVNRVLTAGNIKLNECVRIVTNEKDRSIKNAVIIAPPSAIGSPWISRFAPYSLGVCSGWMKLRGARRRRGADRGFVLSDHCDWPQLGEAIASTGAQRIFVTHGYQYAFAKWLREDKGLEAYEVQTLYGTEEEDI